MLLYIVRHGETLYNKERIFQGAKADSPLTEEGIPVIEKTSEELQDVDFRGIYVSPQLRARKTLEIIMNRNKFIQRNNLEPKILEELREIDLGDWDGAKIETKAQDEQYVNLREFPERYNPTNFEGEDYASLIQRVDKTFEIIKANNDNEDKVLIAGHGTTLTVMINRLLGYGICDIRRDGIMGNASISIVDIDVEKSISKLIKWNNN